MGFDIITSPNMDSPVPPQGTTTYSDGKSNEYWANQFAFDQHIGSFDSPKDWGKMPQGLSVWDFISFDTDYLDIDGMGAEYVVETIMNDSTLNTTVMGAEYVVETIMNDSTLNTTAMEAE